MRIAIQASIDLTVESRSDADALMMAFADDARVIGLEYTTTERVLVPIRDESLADFGMDAA
jgi:hypothetical protein